MLHGSSCHDVSLTKQQQAILDTASPPGQCKAKVFRVNAAAGTGKTTTLIALGRRLVELGHSPCYVAFNRSTQQEAITRFGILASKVTVKTIDACALCAMKTTDGELLPIDLKFLTRKIKDMFGQKVEKLALAVTDPKKRPSWRTRILRNIEKTLETFLRSADTKVQRCYYGAKSDFNNVKGLCHINPEVWYPKQAAELWRFLSNRKNRVLHSHESVMKIAHLSAAKIQNCTSILCDESQDLNPCQIEWLKLQCSRYGTPLWFVGDCAQSIYGFRGARPEHLQSVGGGLLHLTKSWRFGPKMADAPNTILFAKKHSPQQWEPYYVEGCSKQPGQITAEDFSDQDYPFTVLARSNIELLTAGLKYLGKDSKVKIFVNGAVKKWMDMRKSFLPFWNVWLLDQCGERCPLKLGQWEKYSDVSWQEVCDDTNEEGSNTEYRMIVHLINQHQLKAKSAMETFIEKVVKKSTTMPDADIILSTIHSAKGMEWDRVQVLDGALRRLVTFAFDGNKARFAFGRDDEPSYKPDDINLWYVAVTRAKRQLSVPPKFINVQVMFDIIRLVSKRGTGVHPKTIKRAFEKGKFVPEKMTKEECSEITPTTAVTGGYDRRRVDLINRDLVAAYDRKFDIIFEDIFDEYTVMLEWDREDLHACGDAPRNVHVPRTPVEAKPTALNRATPAKRARDSAFGKGGGPKVVKKFKQSDIRTFLRARSKRLSLRCHLEKNLVTKHLAHVVHA